MLSLGLLILIGSTSGNAGSAVADHDVSRIIERTRTTQTTYSLFMWNRITIDGHEPIEEWSAEFHKGSLHRVETPMDRIVADCAALTGVHLNLVTGEETSDPSVAKEACGINANKAVLSAQWLGQVETRFGPTDRVKLVDNNNIRTYYVSREGALVGATIADRDGTMRLLNAATELLPTVPSTDIFSAASLKKGAVPDEFRRKPAEAF